VEGGQSERVDERRFSGSYGPDRTGRAAGFHLLAKPTGAVCNLDCSCDHFVEPRYRLGNIKEQHMLKLVASQQQRQFGLEKRNTLPRYCLECDVRFACHGGCPKDRFITTPDGDPGLNYLCAGFKDFFHHVDGPMHTMGELLRQNRAPSEIVQLYAAEDAKRGRNDPCTCGNGRKWKHCHGAAPSVADGAT